MTKHLITASCLLTGLVSTAKAAVVYFPNQEIPIPTTYAGVSVNFETGAFTNSAAGASGAVANFLRGGLGVTNDADEDAITPSWQPVRLAGTNSDPIVDLGVGAFISGSSPIGDDFGASIGTGPNSHFATFDSGVPGYIGFELTLQDTTTAYGWARVTLQDDNTTGVIHEWAFEDSGASIRVAEIPEPGQTVLAMFGLALLALRRRK